MANPKKRPTRRRRSPSTSNRRADEFLHQVGIRPRMVADDFWEHLCSSYGVQANTFLEYVDRRRTTEKADATYHENIDLLYRLKNASLDFSIALSSQYFGRLYSSYLAVVTSLGLDKNANRILDLGCDNGILSAFYATHFPGASVLGIDRCEEAISCANDLKDRLQLRNLSFLAADAFRDPGPADVPMKTWDMVFMTLCGYEEVDRSPGTGEQVAERFHEYLRPGGVGLVVEYPNSQVLGDLLVYGGKIRQWTLAYQAFGGDEQVVDVVEIEAIQEPRS